MKREDPTDGNRGRALRILVPTTTLLAPDRSAGDRRLLALLEILARTHRVDCSVLPSAPLPLEHVMQVKSLLQRSGIGFLNPGWHSFAAALFRTWYDVALFEFYHQAEKLLGTVRAKQPDARMVVDSVDVHFERQLAGAAL